MSDLETLIFIVSLCAKVISNDLITPSESFKCEQTQKILITYYFQDDKTKYLKYLDDNTLTDFN